MDLPPEMVVILATYAPLFSDRVWAKAQLLAIGPSWPLAAALSVRSSGSWV